MADDEIEKIEKVFGALSRMSLGDEAPDAMADARCPKCGASNFVNVPDLYDAAAIRRENPDDDAGAIREGGLTDAEILSRFSPPTRRSAAGRAIATAVPLGAIVFFVVRRYGSLVGELAGFGAAIIVIMVLMTGMRRFSDEYYTRRARWRKTYMCRECGQLVAS